MSALAAIFEDWLDDHAPWARRAEQPAVELVSPERAASLRGSQGRGHGRIRGLYEAERSIIYLVEPWDPRDAEDASALLHELVHHRQAAVHWACPSAQELPAYRLQEAWLNERGLEARVNWIAVVLETNCSPRDFHPD